MNQKGFVNIIIIGLVVIVLGVASYFVVGLMGTRKQEDKLAPMVENILANKSGKIKECSKEVRYFFILGRPIFPLPASVLSKQRNDPWKALPVSPQSSPLGSQVTDVGVFDLAVNQENCKELYIVSDEGVAFKSTDGGEHWKELHLFNSSASGALSGMIAINPRNTDELLVGVEIPVHSEATRYALFASDDGGNHFSPVGLEQEFTRQPTQEEIEKLFEQFALSRQSYFSIKSEDLKWYRNESYKFKFPYPKDHTVFTEIDEIKEVLIPAVSSSKYVAIAENEAHLFCCEPAVLSISIVDEKTSARDWFDRNFQKYTSKEEIKSVYDTGFIKEGDAVGMTGGGNLGSTYKLLVVSRGDYLVVVNQNQPSKLLDYIRNSLVFHQ